MIAQKPEAWFTVNRRRIVFVSMIWLSSVIFVTWLLGSQNRLMNTATVDLEITDWTHLPVTTEELLATTKAAPATTKVTSATTKVTSATTKVTSATTKATPATTKVTPISIKVWPLPQKISQIVDNFTISLSSEFVIHTTSQSHILSDGVKRYHSIFQSITKNHTESKCGDGSVRTIEVVVNGDDEHLLLNTSYEYNITVDVATGIEIHAETPFGALYGLETVTQLFADGCLGYSHIQIEDYPDYRHRGFMLDTGRRFVPKELILNFLDAMSYVKMNVFHWHISDFCIFSIESKVFPRLTSCYDESDRYYTQEEAREVVQYAKNRGIRVIPEIDIPGHARGMRCLSNNISFCPGSTNQVYNDPEGKSVTALKMLFEEIMEIFPDEYIHFGADEIGFHANCNFENTHNLETAIAQFILDKGRVPVAWQEAYQTTKVDIPGLVIQAWTGQSAKEFAKTGHPSIQSLKEWYYFDSPYGPRDHWTLWNSPLGMEDKNNPYQHLILGGEFTMWGDLFTKTWQCWNNQGDKLPNAYWLHDKAHDELLMDAMAGEVWPRGVASAGRFWHHVPALDKKVLVEKVNGQAQIMISRGVRSCPIGCECDCKSRCGEEYPH